MRRLLAAARWSGGCVLAAVVCLSLFGLVLAALEAAGLTSRPAYQLAAALLAAAVALTAGGYVAGRSAGQRRALYGAAFGAGFGLLAFTYILGPSWEALAGTLLSGALGWLGGRIAKGVPENLAS